MQKQGERLVFPVFLQRVFILERENHQDVFARINAPILPAHTHTSQFTSQRGDPTITVAVAASLAGSPDAHPWTLLFSFCFSQS